MNFWDIRYPTSVAGFGGSFAIKNRLRNTALSSDQLLIRFSRSFDDVNDGFRNSWLSSMRLLFLLPLEFPVSNRISTALQQDFRETWIASQSSSHRIKKSFQWCFSLLQFAPLTLLTAATCFGGSTKARVFQESKLNENFGNANETKWWEFFTKKSESRKDFSPR